MADTRSTVNTELKENQGNVPTNGTNSVYTRTFSFPVVATDDGTASDVLNTITIPANTQILGIASKSSVAQTATFAWSLSTAGAFGDAQVAGTAKFKGHTMTEDNTCTGDADETLVATLGTAICVAGTITVTVTCAALGSTAGTFTTYTN